MFVCVCVYVCVYVYMCVMVSLIAMAVGEVRGTRATTPSVARLARLECVRVARLECFRVARLECVRVARLECVRVARLECVRVARLECVRVARLECVVKLHSVNIPVRRGQRTRLNTTEHHKSSRTTYLATFGSA
jgi:hypothetical protein